MQSSVNVLGETLQRDIRSGAAGYRARLLGFMRELSADGSLERAAVMACMRLEAAQGEDREPIQAELCGIVDKVMETYSFEDSRERAAQRTRADFEVARRFLASKSVTYRGRGLTKAFGDKFKLGPIDVEISKGDITGVVGENGNGKTTLFRLIAGITAPDAGEFEYPFAGGSSTGSLNWSLIKSRIAYVPQELPVWRGSLKQILQYEAAIHGIRGEANDREVDFVVERLGLSEHLDKRWNQLSGGYKFRFALARALAWQPDMMILDEPLANLDVNAQLALLRDIKSMATSVSHPIAVFMSSQHLHEVEAIADNLIFLSRGQSLFNGRRDQLGTDRDENVFEFGCSESVQELIRLLPKDLAHSLTLDGLHYTMTTALDMNPTGVLQALTTAGIELHYFRDISRSSKNLFRAIA